MATDDVVGLCLVSFLGGAVVTLFIFAVLFHLEDRKQSNPLKESRDA